MTAKEAKIKLMWYYLSSGRFISTLTETKLFNGYIADMLVLDVNFISTEIEIKVKLDDLWSELKAIQKWKKLLPLDYPIQKCGKHNYYLEQKFNDCNKEFIPNKFYFAVAGEKLLKDAKKELEGTPYGLIYLPEAIGATFDPQVIIIGKKLHNIPVDKDFLAGNLRRMSWENYNLMKKLNGK